MLSTVQSLRDVQVARLPSHRVIRSEARSYPLGVILHEMRVGNTTLIGGNEVYSSISLKQHCARAKDYRKRGWKLDYDLTKSELPAFCPTGTFNGSGNIASPSGLLLIEFDDVDAASVMGEIIRLPITLASWTTLSGEGVAALFRLETHVTNTADYRHAWVCAAAICDHIAEADTSTAEFTHLRVMNYDPYIYTNDNAIPMKWHHDEEAVAEAFPARYAPVGSFESLPNEYKDAIKYLDWNENGWSTNSIPCPFNEHEHDGWDLPTNATGVNKHDNGYTFRCFKCNESRRYLFAPPVSYTHLTLPTKA